VYWVLVISGSAKKLENTAGISLALTRLRGKYIARNGLANKIIKIFKNTL